MLTVGDLKELIEELPDETEVRLVEFGYRSRNQSYADGAAVGPDARTQDDWGMDKKGGGDRVYIKIGGTADNRYPPMNEDEFDAGYWD